MNRLLVSLVITFISHVSPSAAEWSLPLDDANANVSFEVDSTWHLVKGTVKGLTGRIPRLNDRSSQAIESLIHCLVGRFETGSESRDERLREIFAEPRYPDVVFHGTRLVDGCEIVPKLAGGSCRARYLGTLTIRDTTLPVSLPISVLVEEGRLIVHGETIIRSREYGVEDPSILIARLHEDVKVKIKLELPLTAPPHGDSE